VSLHPRRHALRFRLATAVWLTAVWVLLWGDLTVANVLGGAVVGGLVTALMPMPAIEFHGRVHLPNLAHLVYRFGVDLVVASAQVAVRALRGQVPHGAVLAVHLRSHSDLYLTMTAELCSLVPGSIVVEAHRLTGMLYVHVLDVDTAGGTEHARQHVLDVEARVMRALASDDELAEAGLTRSRRGDGRPQVHHEAVGR
jgi:multicomponent Na+:H+ antiporter subunit E